MKHAELARVTRNISVAHGEAFQLMRYTADGEPDLWIWNSRDGVTPFGLTLDGAFYHHAMGSYHPRYSAVLPDEAEHVWVDYDRAAWADLQRSQYERFAGRPDKLPFGGADFRERYPSLDDWLAIVPFEHGSPRRLSRDEFRAWTSSYAGGASS
jgi:hypothetical protein